VYIVYTYTCVRVYLLLVCVGGKVAPPSSYIFRNNRIDVIYYYIISNIGVSSLLQQVLHARLYRGKNVFPSQFASNTIRTRIADTSRARETRGGDVISSRVGLNLILVLHRPECRIRTCDYCIVYSQGTLPRARAIHQEGPRREAETTTVASQSRRKINTRSRKSAAAPRSWPSRQDGVRGVCRRAMFARR